MEFDFDTAVDRRNTGAYKWEVAQGELPMWVADMDFPTAPPVIAALVKRAQLGVFGYETVTPEWESALIAWWKTRHGFQIQRDWLLFATGIVPAISSIVRKRTTMGEKIAVITPVYNIFYNSILNNGRHVAPCPLRYDKATGYRLDLADLARILSDPQVSMLLLCNPHNPIGKIWDRETLAQIGQICLAHHVLVVSDEIHCDITDPHCGYTPFASVSAACAQNSITCLSPTKAFNLAGLQTAAVVVPNEALRHKVWRGLNSDEIAEPNSFAMIAAIAAFSHGAPWLDALRQYLFENKQFAIDVLAKALPQITVVPSDATYLLWLDCGIVSADSTQLCAFIRKETGLYLSDGQQFGGNGQRFLRMNIACPRAQLEEGLHRLAQAIPLYEGWSASLC